MIGVGVIAAISRSLGDVSRQSLSHSRIQDEAGFRDIFKARFSCANTITTPGCLASYTLRDRNNNSLGTKLGIYNIRNRCVTNELIVEYRSEKKDPVLKRLPPWKAVFPPGVGLCRSEILGTPPNQCPPGEVVVGIGADGRPICTTLSDLLAGSIVVRSQSSNFCSNVVVNSSCGTGRIIGCSGERRGPFCPSENCDVMSAIVQPGANNCQVSCIKESGPGDCQTCVAHAVCVQ